jgi:hypothetical protein
MLRYSIIIYISYLTLKIIICAAYLEYLIIKCPLFISHQEETFNTILLNVPRLLLPVCYSITDASSEVSQILLMIMQRSIWTLSIKSRLKHTKHKTKVKEPEVLLDKFAVHWLKISFNTGIN